jgi:hypothetical protein
MHGLLMSKPIAVTIDGCSDATIELALKRTIAAFSQSQEGDFFNYLKKILLENQIHIDGNRIKINHVKFPSCMTENQMKTVKERIQYEIRLYAPIAVVIFCGFPASAPKLSNAFTNQRDVHQLGKIE